MSNFFITLRSNSRSLIVRVIQGLAIFIGGWFAYAFFNFFVSLDSNGINYTTTSYVGILVEELIAIDIPLYLFVALISFIVLMVIFQNISWKKLGLVAIIIGIIPFTFSYATSLLRWQPLLQTVQDLPVLEVKYHRHSGTFPDTRPGMWIQFIVLNNSVKEVKKTINTRLTENKAKLLKYRLNGNSPLTVEFNMTDRKGRINGILYVRPAFQGYDY